MASFLECGPKEKLRAVWELCETLGCGTEFPTLTPNVRPHIARATPALARPSAGEGSSQIGALY